MSRSMSGIRRFRSGHAQREAVSRQGSILLETLIAFSALLVTMLAFSRVIVSSSVATETNHESTIAKEAGRQMIETLQAEDFANVFALYNESDQDDPGGVGTGPGKDFPVASLELLDDDPDGFVGEILFPTTDGLNVREDLDDPRWGGPRDLNGDTDTIDVLPNGGFGLLPVVVRLEWTSASGSPAKLELRTLLANY